MKNVRRFLCCLLVIFLSSNSVFSVPPLSEIPAFDGQFSVFKVNGKVGLKNDQGQVVIPATYDELGWSNGTFSVVNNITGFRKNNLWGLLNITTKRTTSPEFSDIAFGTGSLLIARKKVPGTIEIKFGIINTEGKEIIPFAYDGLKIYSFRVVVQQKRGNTYKKGLIDLENNVLIPVSFQDIYPIGSLRFAVESVDNKTGIFSEDGKQLSEFVIDSISSFKKDFAVIYQRELQGLMDGNGDVKLEPIYREIKINNDGTVNVLLPGTWLLLDGENKLLHQLHADSIEALTNEVYKVRSGRYTRLAGSNLKDLNADAFSDVSDFQGGFATFKRGRRFGAINAEGKVVIPPDYDKLIIDQKAAIANGIFNSNSRWMIIDFNGKPVTQKYYEEIRKYNGSFYPVKNRGYWGAVDLNGNEIIACVHEAIEDQYGDKVVIRFKGKHGIINLREDWIVVPQQNELSLINDSLYFEKTQQTTFIRNMRGRVVYFTDNKIEYNGKNFSETLANGATWTIGLNGTIENTQVTPAAIEEIYPESEGLRAIKRNDRYGFVDDRGRLRIANRYENVKHFSEGLAAAMIRGKWGFIGKDDKIAIQPVFDEVTSFTNGYALVKQHSLYGLIDNKGNVILPLRYESIRTSSSGRFQVKQNGLWGISDEQGRIIINPKYDELKDLDNGYVIAIREGKYGLITQQGLSTIPMIYDGLTYDAYHKRFLALKKANWETKTF